MFKTLLVASGDPARGGEVAVAIVPVSTKLSLKAAGAALGLKRVEMCDPAVAQRLTGYVLGGISPFGQKKPLRTAIDETCELFDVVYVSGGRRGLDVGVAPADLRAAARRGHGRPHGLSGRRDRRPRTSPAGWRRSASMRATRVRAGGCEAASRARHPIARWLPPMATTRRSAAARLRP